MYHYHINIYLYIQYVFISLKSHCFWSFTLDNFSRLVHVHLKITELKSGKFHPKKMNGWKPGNDGVSNRNLLFAKGPLFVMFGAWGGVSEPSTSMTLGFQPFIFQGVV